MLLVVVFTAVGYPLGAGEFPAPATPTDQTLTPVGHPDECCLPHAAGAAHCPVCVYYPAVQERPIKPAPRTTLSTAWMVRPHTQLFYAPPHRPPIAI